MRQLLAAAILVAAVLLATACGEESPVAPAVEGPALIVFYSDN